MPRLRSIESYINSDHDPYKQDSLEIIIPAWSVLAACKDYPNPDIFCPFWGDRSMGGKDTKEAKKVCDCCEVKEECLEYGLDEPIGVWGGQDPTDRRRIRLERARLRGEC